MKRLFLALIMGVVLLLTAGVGTATAESPVSQASGQAAGSEQDAGAAAGTAQQEPSNENASVRVLSPGDDGSVSQSNEASSEATAGNTNRTEQDADQDQAGGSGLQALGQANENDQDALALAATLQEGAANGNGAVSDLSAGDGGSVSQSNEASSEATAANANETEQEADQAQDGSGLQAIGQSSENEQDATALSTTEQEQPSNENVSVRVLSPGDDGSVSQSNEASSEASAGNTNTTEQEADQGQSGDSCKCKGSGEQVIGQSAANEQDATAVSKTVQEKPSNSNVTVRVLSPGDDGRVSQSNEATSEATAANLNETQQEADQAQGGGSGSQVIGQSAANEQDATAVSETVQEKPSNSNVTVRVLSPGHGGSVSQSNVASSKAEAGNTNQTAQDADQSQAGDSCKCRSDGSQVIGQSAKNDQDATALSATQQEKPSNSNVTVRVLSPGDDGRVSQSNEASSEATAANLNTTKQDADQSQAGGSCKCGGAGGQFIGQSADNDQDAKAASLTAQNGATNENVSVRVLSPGDGGSVSQSNTASSEAKAGNTNWTGQDADQTQDGSSCKCGSGGTQVIGQSAESDQDAAALSATIQEKPSNSNVPVRVLSKGDDGRVSQSNEASSEATAANLNATKQEADQAQAGGPGWQVIGQSAQNDQDAFALGLTLQLGASNENAPVRVLSPGDGGSVSQSNAASSEAKAGNTNWTGQDADQSQGAKKGLDGHCCGTGIQAIGQQSDNEQDAKAFSLTAQLGLKQPCRCKDSGFGNRNEPVRVGSPGDDGSVRQSHEASSEAKAANWNATKQHADQIQAHPCRCKAGLGIQAIGQLDKSRQHAAAIAATLQLGAVNEWAPDRKKSPGKSGDRIQLRMKAALDFSGSRTATDQSKTQVKR